jgi:hypothetical protein
MHPGKRAAVSPRSTVSRRSNRMTSRANVVRRAAIESLEERRMLSSYGLSSGVLTVTGDANAANRLSVDLLSSSAQLMVTCNGGGMYAPVSSVKRIVITGGNGDDTVWVNPSINIPCVVQTYNGTDSVATGAAADSIVVGNGNDYVDSRGGNDTIVAGNGHDTLHGDTGNDSITAGSGGNLIYGEQDNDTIISGAGNDTISGADGNDSIVGGGGTDYIEGDAGNDTLIGGSGNDTLVGGTGADTMNAEGGSNTYPDLAPEDFAPEGTVLSAFPQAGVDPSLPLTAGGAIVNNNATATGSNHGDSTAPTPVIQLTGVTGAGPHAVFVQGVDSALGAGNYLTADYQWDFGDPSGSYNKLTGFNASHIYDNPGTYTITLTVTNQLGKTSSVSTQVKVTQDTRRDVYVDNSGNDSNNGLTPQTAVKTVDRSIQLLGSGVRLLFHTGQTFNVDQSISLPYHDVLVGSYGGGSAQPVLNRVTGDGTSIIGMYDNSSQIVIQDLTMNSPYPAVGAIADKMAADGIFPAGTNVAIRRITFLNLDVGVDCDRNPTGTLVQDCTAPLATGLRGVFIWGQGTDQVYLGNTVANSTREHDIRTVGTVRQLIAYNNLTNLDRRPQGDAADYNKGTIDLHRSSFDYVYGNYLYDGELRTGPYGGDGEPDNTGTDWTVIEQNHVYNYSMQILPGTHHLMVRNNVFTVTNDSDITIDPVGGGMVSDDINIVNNTGITNGTTGHFLYLDATGMPDRQIAVENNLWIAPNAVGGESSAIDVADNNLRAFDTIANNVWQLPASADSWAGGGLMYVYPQWGYQQGWITAAKWATESNVSHDTFASTSVSSNLTPAVGSIAATGAVSVPGVWNDLYGNLRPASHGSVGAVQVNGVAPTSGRTGSSSSNGGTGSISGTFFYDSNANGVWDSGESISPSWLVYIDANNDGKYDSGDTEIRADGSGRFTFGNLSAGTYVIRAETASGWTRTNAVQTVSLAAGQNDTSVNIGEVQGSVAAAPSVKGSVSGTFFYDSNGNGTWDSNEKISPLWLVYIDANNDGKYDSGDTEIRADSNGRFTFGNLAAGTYHVRAEKAAGWTETSPANGAAVTVTVAAGQAVSNVNFGEVQGTIAAAPIPTPTGSVSGTFFYDSNGNGVWNSGEAASPQWYLYIDANKDGKYDAGDTEIRADTSGRFTFSGLAAGTYVIRAATAAGWQQTTANPTLTIVAGQAIANVNFGERMI